MPAGSPIVVLVLMFLGASCTSASPSETPTGAPPPASSSGSAPVAPPQATPIWTAATGSAASPPVVVDGVVYVSTEKGPLYAFDANCATGGGTCTPLWTGNTGGATVATSPAPFSLELPYPVWFDVPVVADGMVYVVGASARTMLAFSTDCPPEGGRCDPTWIAATGPHTSLPVAGDGLVYVTADERLKAYPSDCTTGGGMCQPLWTTSGDPSGFMFESPPVVVGGMVFAKTFRGGLYAFDATTGALAWHATAGHVTGGHPTDGAYGSFGSPPVVDGHMVFVGWSAFFSGTGSRLYAFETGCGTGGDLCRPVWTAELPDDILTVVGPAATGGMVYVGTETHPLSGEAHIYAFDERCSHVCTPASSTEVPGELVVTGPPTVGQGSVVATSAEGGLVVLAPARCDASECGLRWLSRSDLSPLRATVADGLVFVGGATGTLFAFDQVCSDGGGSCRPAWTFTGKGGLISTPAVVDGVAFATTDAGDVYALPETGPTQG